MKAVQSCPTNSLWPKQHENWPNDLLKHTSKVVSQARPNQCQHRSDTESTGVTRLTSKAMTNMKKNWVTCETLDHVHGAHGGKPSSTCAGPLFDHARLLTPLFDFGSQFFHVVWRPTVTWLTEGVGLVYKRTPRVNLLQNRNEDATNLNFAWS